MSEITTDPPSDTEQRNYLYEYYSKLLAYKTCMYKYRHLFGAIIASVVVTTPPSTWWQICRNMSLFLIKCVGQTLSLGLGLGFALSISQKLNAHNLSSNDDSLHALEDEHVKFVSKMTNQRSSSLSNQNSSLMRTTSVLSGSRTYTGKGEDDFVLMFPNLSSQICAELGIFSDLVVRDFIKCWYCKIDSRCIYDPTGSKGKKDGEDEVSDFIALIHRALVSLIGSLATFVRERTNLCKLVLIQYIEVIALEVKTYRSLHARATQRVKQRYLNRAQNMTDDEFNAVECNSKEYCIGLEYALKGMLHPALTYKLDTGNSTSRKESFTHISMNGFENIGVCELNYLRMISKELCKILLQDSEWNSKVTRSLCIEVLAGCVLFPIMQLISVPEFYNQLVVESQAITKSDAETSGNLNGTPIVHVDSNNDSDDKRGDTVESITAEYIKTEETSDKGSTNLNGSAFIDNWISKAVSPQEDSDLADRATILPMLTLAVIEVQNILSVGGSEDIRWETPECRTAVCQLVLSIEAALQHRKLQRSTHSRITLCGVLMQLTEDLDSFELLDEFFTEDEEEKVKEGTHNKHDDEGDFQFKNDLATLRTLIATWLQTGMVYQILSVFISKDHYILDLLYSSDAFFKSSEEAQFFVSQLKILDGLEILVDTMALLSAEPYRFSADDRPPTDKAEPEKNEAAVRNDVPSLAMSNSLTSSMPSSKNIKKWWTTGNNPKTIDNQDNLSHKLQRATSNLIKVGGEMIGNPSSTEIKRSAEVTISHTPSPLHQRASSQQKLGSNESVSKYYSDFRPNIEITGRLRMERQRRQDSWNIAVKTILNSTGDKRILLPPQSQYCKLQRRYSESFYNSIHIMDIEESKGMISVEPSGSRRSIEVPDVDSSLLSRASSRPITPIGEHRNPRLSDQDYRSYAVSHEQTIPHIKTRRANYHPGAYIHRALLRYYPNDRTATVDDPRWTHDDRAACNLPRHFKVSRQPLNKIRSGVNLAGNLLGVGGEVGDFVATPRSGKSVDFVYRMSLFQLPQVEVGGVRFKVYDAINGGCIPRADASSRELSDASFTAAIIRSGDKYSSENTDEQYISAIMIRSNQAHGLTAFSPGQLRGTLWRASTLQQCHLKTLLHHTRNNTVRSLNTNNNKNEVAKSLLRPTLSLIHFASSRVKEKERLCRDLGLGYRHVALDYLQRKGLYFRKESQLISIKVDVLDSVQYQTSDILGSTTVEYKLRVRKISRLSQESEEPDKHMLEEWCIFRRFTDFTLLNKHLRSQMAEQAVGTKIVQKLPNFITAKTQEEGLPLLPPLNTQGKVPGTSSNRFIQRRMSDIQLYLDILVSKNHLLRESYEVMRFLAANEPISKDVENLHLVGGKPDAFGRTELRRNLITCTTTNGEKNTQGISPGAGGNSSWIATGTETFTSDRSASKSINAVGSNDTASLSSSNNSSFKTSSTEEEKSENQYGDKATEASLIARISEVKLVTFQKVLFEFVSHTFHLDKATFFRSSVVSAIWRVAFVITGTTSAQFTRNLTNWHLKHITGDSLGGIIRSIRQSLWPNGVWYTPSPSLTKEEKKALEEESRNVIDKLLPDQVHQVKSVLGDEFDKGIDTLHEMVQNRVVLKSLLYTLLDLLLLEIFPELKDHLGVMTDRNDPSFDKNGNSNYSSTYTEA